MNISRAHVLRSLKPPRRGTSPRSSFGQNVTKFVWPIRPRSSFGQNVRSSFGQSWLRSAKIGGAPFDRIMVSKYHYCAGQFLSPHNRHHHTARLAAAASCVDLPSKTRTKNEQCKELSPPNRQPCGSPTGSSPRVPRARPSFRNPRFVSQNAFGSGTKFHSRAVSAAANRLVDEETWQGQKYPYIHDNMDIWERP